MRGPKDRFFSPLCWSMCCVCVRSCTWRDRPRHRTPHMHTDAGSIHSGRMVCTAHACCVHVVLKTISMLTIVVVVSGVAERTLTFYASSKSAWTYKLTSIILFKFFTLRPSNSMSMTHTQTHIVYSCSLHTCNYNFTTCYFVLTLRDTPRRFPFQ